LHTESLAARFGEFNVVRYGTAIPCLQSSRCLGVQSPSLRAWSRRICSYRRFVGSMSGIVLVGLVLSLSVVQVECSVPLSIGFADWGGSTLGPCKLDGSASIYCNGFHDYGERTD